MSATVLYILNGKSVTYFDELENGWGTGPAACDFLLDKYYGPGILWGFGQGKAIDALIDERRLEADELMVMLFLRERAYIPREYLQLAAEACETFGARLPDDGNVNHWPAIGMLLREMSEVRLSRHAVGACMAASDVMDQWRCGKGLADKGWAIFKPIQEAA